ncbi:hypothetical protein NECAME_04109 [Necator americanus]|uniref:Uncharacterized protein n=1 Tax=Necator americanus TaxID=51031 RepID=W2SWV1_NECAM|nr:hypothetical protein NECAME_04109 [Necator americanus]ETN74244.1 hypothetical protein NECAME_04109 [Necator americanus]
MSQAILLVLPTISTVAVHQVTLPPALLVMNPNQCVIHSHLH